MSVKVEHLSKVFGEQKAVNNISFELAKGTITGFLGPNGAGKSTTMKMITTYIPPTSGKIQVCGFDVEEQAMEVRKRIGYLPESNPLYYDMYIKEYLEFTAGIHQLGKKAKPRIAEIIEMTGLQKEVRKKIGALSKGYKQRVGIAQAMIHDPEVLVLDEPTSGLDPNQIAEIRDLIIKLGREKTVLLSTHIMQEVQAMCSRIIIINNGSIVADDVIGNIQATAIKEETTTLLVSFDCELEKDQLLQLAHVDNALPSGPGNWQIVTTRPDALRKELMAWAVSRDIAILSMNSQVQTLEDVFRGLTQK